VVDDARQIAGFMRDFKSKLAREVNRLTAGKDPSSRVATTWPLSPKKREPKSNASPISSATESRRIWSSTRRIGRASNPSGPGVGATRCSVEHVGMVLSGKATAAFDDGRVFELCAGELFYIPPVPHDSWVLGEEPYVSLHFLGADRYAK